MFTRPRLQINLKTIQDNYLTLKGIVKPAKAACVLKNNAYGLGIQPVGKALYQAGCRTFFVAHGWEGAQLRPVVGKSRIFTLQGFGIEDEAEFKHFQLTPVLPTVESVYEWFKQPFNRLKPALQVETGLNRLGVSYEDVFALRHLSFSLILSHLSCADDINHPLNLTQLTTFQKFQPLFRNTPFSFSASDGIFLGKDFHFDIVRLGAALYGLNTAPHHEKQVKNCLRLMGPVLQIKTVSPNETIGYGAAHKTTQTTKIATVSIGYADGIFRSFSPKGILHIEKDGQIFVAPIVGRVSMDNITCDVTNIPDSVLEQTKFMTVISDFYDADDFAHTVGTIGYEVLNNIGHSQRILREYVA